MLIKIPQYAKDEAKKALKRRSELSKSKKFGLTKAEANKLNIRSGVEQAKKLITKPRMSLKELKPYYSFLNRFKSQRSIKSEGSISLWGGRRFAKFLNRLFK